MRRVLEHPVGYYNTSVQWHPTSARHLTLVEHNSSRQLIKKIKREKIHYVPTVLDPVSLWTNPAEAAALLDSWTVALTGAQ